MYSSCREGHSNQAALGRPMSANIYHRYVIGYTYMVLGARLALIGFEAFGSVSHAANMSARLTVDHNIIALLNR